MEAKNVDDILVRDMQPKGAIQPQTPAITPTPEPEHAPEPPSLASAPQDQGAQAPEQAEVPRGTIEQKDAAQPEEQPEIKQEASQDEYGQPVAPPRTYTEQELEHILNDRMARSRIALKQQELQQQQQVAQPPRNQETQPENTGEQSWEAQLDSYIDRRLDTRQAQLREAEWKRQEDARQENFQRKFESGRNKYQDFESVVGKVSPSLTPSMMLATRSLNDPAAFLYAAAKQHAGELERISKINDNYAQAAEVGRLHEKMVKFRANLTNAPKPIEVPKSDMPHKPVNPQLTLEQRIHDYAKQKRR